MRRFKRDNVYLHLQHEAKKCLPCHFTYRVVYVVRVGCYSRARAVRKIQPAA